MNIAVLIPCYNAARYLGDCLDSLLVQTVPVSVWCCDDGSTDATEDILKRYAAKGVHVLTQPNAGVSAARNRLLEALPPEVEAVGFVDADDYVHPKMFELLAAGLATGASVAQCDVTHVAAEAKRGEGFPELPAKPVIFAIPQPKLGNWINIWNKLYRRAAIGAVRFREDLAFEEDNFFNQEVFARSPLKAMVLATLYAYRRSPTSVTSRLDLNRYTESCLRRIALSLDVIRPQVKAADLPAFHRDLALDLYRMVIRKNLCKNREAVSRHAIFRGLAPRLRALEREHGFVSAVLPLVPRLAYRAARAGRYSAAYLLAHLT